ncbi:hypothetical protein ACFONG_03475 [Uliginosibacterium paludis]|uniref:Lipoprotein n=1 Tax=Uliginosibacterium paludis TaxID=1615952 RepID=A0ABV2CNT4_9RHOO
MIRSITACVIATLLLGGCGSVQIQKSGMTPVAAEGDWQFNHPEVHDSRTQIRDICMKTMFRDTNEASRPVRCAAYAACQITSQRSQVAGATETQFCQSVTKPSARWNTLQRFEQLLGEQRN